jgi:hypothetical protein
LERTWHSSAKGSARSDTGSGPSERSSRAVSLGSGVSDVSSVGAARGSWNAIFGSGALATGSGASEPSSEGTERSHDASATGSLGAVTGFRGAKGGFVSAGRIARCGRVRGKESGVRSQVRPSFDMLTTCGILIFIFTRNESIDGSVTRSGVTSHLGPPVGGARRLASPTASSFQAFGLRWGRRTSNIQHPSLPARWRGQDVGNTLGSGHR